MRPILLAITIFLFAGIAHAGDHNVQLAQNSCCNCDPHDSDMQCFMECNAELPRCQAPAPRPAPIQRQAITPYCCAGGRKVALFRRGRAVSRYVVGAPCSVTYALITVSGQGCM